MNWLKKINIPVFSHFNIDRTVENSSLENSSEKLSKKEFFRPENLKASDSAREGSSIKLEPLMKLEPSMKPELSMKLLQNTDLIINLPEKVAFYVPKTNKPVHDTQTKKELLGNIKMVSFLDWPNIKDIMKEFDALPQYRKIPQKAKFKITLLTLMLLSDETTNENVRIKLINDNTRKRAVYVSQFGEKREHGLVRNVTRFKAAMDNGEFFDREFTIDQVPEKDFISAGVPVLKSEALRYYDDGFYLKFPDELVKSAMQIAYFITWKCKGFS